MNFIMLPVQISPLQSNLPITKTDDFDKGCQTLGLISPVLRAWSSSSLRSLKYIFIYVCSLQLERNGHNMSSPWGLSFLPLDWACQIVLICWTVTKQHEKRESRLVCHLIDRQTLISLLSLFCTQLVLLYTSEVHVWVVLFTAGHCEEFVIRNSSCP